MTQISRRLFLVRAACTAGAAVLPAVPARAATGSRFDREVAAFAPDPVGKTVQDRLNALIEDLSAAGGGTVRLAPGLYPVGDSVRVLDGVRLVGAGMRGGGASVLRLVDDAPEMARNAGILRLKRDSVPPARRIVHEVAVEDLAIDGNRAGQRQGVWDAEKKYGLYAEAEDLVLRRVTTFNCMGYGFDPHGTFDGHPSRRVLIEACHSHHNAKDGFTLDHQVSMVMRDCLSEFNDRHGVNICTGTRAARVENCVIRDNGGDGVVVQNGSGGIGIRHCRVVGNRGHGIYMRDSFAMEIRGNYVGSNHLAGVRVRGGGGARVLGNEITWNLAGGTTGQAEVLLDAHGGQGARAVTVEANRIRAGAGIAVREMNGAGGSRIRGNVVSSRMDKEPVVLLAADSHAEGNRHIAL